jgi:hypothetical protein
VRIKRRSSAGSPTRQSVERQNASFRWNLNVLFFYLSRFAQSRMLMKWEKIHLPFTHTPNRFLTHSRCVYAWHFGSRINETKKKVFFFILIWDSLTFSVAESLQKGKEIVKRGREWKGNLISLFTNIPLSINLWLSCTITTRTICKRNVHKHSKDSAIFPPFLSPPKLTENFYQELKKSLEKFPSEKCHKNKFSVNKK